MQSYEPGEQKRRDYTWSIDPSKYRFGTKGGNIPYNGVSSGEQASSRGTGRQAGRSAPPPPSTSSSRPPLCACH